MGWGYHCRCRDCRHDWAGISLSARLGRSTGHAAPDHLERYRLWTCPECLRSLSIPRVLDRNSWRIWRAGPDGDRDFLYLDAIAARIDAILAEGKPYAPRPIELHPGDCPECRRSFEEYEGDGTILPCPRCGGRSVGAVDEAKWNGHYLMASADPSGFA